MRLCTLAAGVLLAAVCRGDTPVALTPSPTLPRPGRGSNTGQPQPDHELEVGGGVEPRGFYEEWRTRTILRRAARRMDRRRHAPQSGGTRVLTDLPYGPHPCQRLDFYLPPGSGFPVVVYVHGGSWISEDKKICASFGQYLAAHGVGALLVNYRLPPEVNVEGELRDAARAVAWAFEHAPEHGGDPGRLFLCGHSAGGHLVSVLATNPTYLGEEHLPAGLVRGVIAVEGVYHIGLGVWPAGLGFVFAGLDRHALSPRDLVSSCTPPFLILTAEHGSRFMHLEARRFQQDLQEAGCPAEWYVIPGEDHYGTVLDADLPNAPQGPRILEFIFRNAGLAPPRD